MENVLRDLRFGLQGLFRNPGFTTAALIALALGIGANSAIFSVVNGVLLRPLPYRDPAGLVFLWEVSGDQEISVAAPANFLDWRKHREIFSEMGAYCRSSVTLTGQGEPLLVKAVSVSPSLLAATGVQPEIGRSFRPEGPEEERAVVLSHGFWQRRFGANPAIVGQTLVLDGYSHVVLGVMPDQFRFFTAPDLFVLGRQGVPVPPYAAPADLREIRGDQYVSVLARLKPGVTLKRAQAGIRIVAQQLERQYPKTNQGWGVKLVPLSERMFGAIRPKLLILSGAVGLVLLIACANVANLLLARAAVREREIAMRVALGAGQVRVVRQLLSESLLLALLGGAIGLLLAYLGVKFVVALGPENIPRLDQTSIDGRVLGFTLLLSLITGLLVGLVPIRRAFHPDLQGALKEGGGKASAGLRRRHYFGLLVVSEVALALVLLLGAGLLVTSFLRLTSVNPGFKPDRVLTLRITLPDAKYPRPPHVLAFLDTLADQLRGIPGVVAAGTTSDLPLSGDSATSVFRIEGRPGPPPGQEYQLAFHAVTPGYLRAMGIPLLKGRDFTWQDRQGSLSVGLINESLARRFWPGADPIGQRILLGPETAGRTDWITIVGVVGDVRHLALGVEPAPDLLVGARYFANMSATLSVVLRASGDPIGLLPAIRQRIAAIDKDLPLSQVMTLRELVAESTAQQRFITLLLTILAGIAFLLALVGIYSVVSFSVSRRTQEVGVRMAFGAQKSDVLWMVVKQGTLLAVAGVVVGLAVALGAARTLKSLLFGVSANDPVILGALSLTLIAVAMVASYIPARRAVMTDPMVALRNE
jgi:putative ABC transport system permease protein